MLVKWHVCVTVQVDVIHAPVTIRSPFGGGVHTPELHADSLEGLMAQQPGLKLLFLQLLMMQKDF